MAEKIIIEVGIDKDEAQRNAAELEKTLTKLRGTRSALQKQLKQLIVEEGDINKRRKESQAILTSLESAGQGMTAEAKRMRIGINLLNQEYNKNQREANGVATQLSSVKTEITQNQRELRVLNRELEVNEGSLNEQRAALSRLTREYDTFRVGVDGTQKDLDKLGTKVAGLTNQIKEQEFSTERYGRNVGNYANSIKDALGSAIPGASNLTGILATGPGAVAGIAAAVGAGVVKLVEFQQALEKQRKEVELLTGATGANLDQTTAAISATVSTTGTEFDENLKAANAVAKSFGDDVFGVTQDIQKGFAAGGNVTGEYLDTLSEYGPIFRELQLESSEFIAITTQSLKSGVFSDSGLATIEEGLLRIREMPDATKAALDSIGLSSSEISAQIASGETDVFDVIQKVSGRLGELPPQSQEVGQAIADIFGGAGEKAGLEYIKTLKDIDLNLDNVLDSSGEFAKQQFELTQANQELDLLFNQLLGSSDGFFTQAKTGAISLLTQGLRGLINGSITLSNFFIKLYNQVLPLRVSIQGLFAGIRTIIDTLQFAFNQVYDAFANIGNVILAVLSGDLGKIKDAIAQGFTDSVDNAKDFGKDVAENYIEGFDNLGKKVDLIKPLGSGDQAEQAAKNIGQLTGQAYSRGVAKGISEADLNASIETIISDIDLEGIEAQNAELELNVVSRIGDIESEIAKENLLFAQQRAKGIEDEEIHNLRLLELKREKLGLEAALLEENSASKTEKLTELAEVEAQIYEDKEQRKADFDKQLQDQKAAAAAAAAEAKAARLTQERAEEDAQLSAAKESADALAQLARTRSDDEKAQAAERRQAFNEQNAAYKAAVIAQKAIAAIEIGINLQREIQSYWATSATAGPAAPAIAVPLTVAAVARSVAALANIARFEDGGSLSNGTHGLATGASHADGGIYATVANRRMINFEGNEFIVRGSAVRNNLAAIQAINQHGSNKKFGVHEYALGGSLVGTSTAINLSQPKMDFNIKEQLREVFSDFPAPVVTVEDINAGVTGVNKIKVRANQ